jgi:hypothetical protein
MQGELSDDDRAAINEALFAGRKIAAIKTCREATGSSLKDAKDAVEAIETVLRAKSPERFRPSGAKRGCLPLLLLVLVSTIIAIAASR